MRTITTLGRRRRHSCGLTAALLALAACGGSDEAADTGLPTLESAADSESAASDDDETDGSDDDTERDPDLALAEFEQCMADQGLSIEIGDSSAPVDELSTIDVGDDAVAPADFDTEDFEAALGECDDLLESSFDSFDLSPEQEAEIADQQLAFQRCLSERGIDIDMSGGSLIVTDENMEALDAAMAACESELPVLEIGEDG